MTGVQINQKIAKIIKDSGGIPACLGYEGFPAESCISINNMAAHGIPNDVPFEDGDIVNVDIVVKAENLLADAARNFVIGEGSQKAFLLAHAAKKTCYAGIAALGPGKDIKEACQAMANELENHDVFNIPYFYGHGINPKLHSEPWSIANPAQVSSYILQPGEYITIEPHVCIYPPQTRSDCQRLQYFDLDLDNWCASHEETILITEDGYEVVTA